MRTPKKKSPRPIQKCFYFSSKSIFFGSEKSFEKLRFPSLSSCCFRPVLSCLSAKMSAVLTKKSSKIGNFLSFTFRIFINSPPKNQELLKIGRSTISQALRYPCRSRVPNLSPLRPKEKLWAPFNSYPPKNLGLDLLTVGRLAPGEDLVKRMSHSYS